MRWGFCDRCLAFLIKFPSGENATLDCFTLLVWWLRLYLESLLEESRCTYIPTPTRHVVTEWFTFTSENVWILNEMSVIFIIIRYVTSHRCDHGNHLDGLMPGYSIHEILGPISVQGCDIPIGSVTAVLHKSSISWSELSPHPSLRTLLD